MTTILVWLGSGFAFAVGVCVGAYAMRRLASERSSPIGIHDIQKRANELLEERNAIGERQAEYLRQLSQTLRVRNPMNERRYASGEVPQVGSTPPIDGSGVFHTDAEARSKQPSNRVAGVDELEPLWEWVCNEREKPSWLAFSEGPARVIAYEIESLESELRRQLNEAWMRLDYATADRIADLLGERRPTDHEAEENQNTNGART